MEIVRGATSSLYGTSAMGGIINLVTEDPKKLTLGGGVQYGTWNTGIYNFKIGKTFDKGFGFILFAEYKHSDGYDYMDDEQWKDYYQAPKVNLLNTTAKLFYNFKNASRLEFIADYHLDKNEMGTSTYYDEKGHTGNFLLRYNSSRTHQITYDLSVYSDRSWNKTDAVKWNTTTEAFDTPYYLTDVPYGKTGIVGQVNAALGVHTLTLGTDIRFYDLESEYTYTDSGKQNYEGKQDFYAVFLNDEISLGSSFDASIGLRYDYWKNKDGKFFDNTSGEDMTINYPEKSSDALSPKIGVVFHPNKQFRLRTSLSSGFKAPSIYYLYRSAPHGSTFDLGNPDLEPEKMTYSYEIGGDYYLTNKLEISATYYISQFKDFLDKVVVPTDEVPDYFNPGEGVIVNKSINIGKVRSQGVETSVRYHITSELIANVAYTYSTSEIKRYEVDEELVGNELDNSPHNLLNVGLHFNKPTWFSAGIWFKYVDEQFSDLENTEDKKLDSYELVDFNLSKSFLKNKLTFSLTINNLFDKKYLTYYSSATTYYNGPSRSIMGGVSYNF
jgi:iron complex outermembrane receptor protein